MVIASYFCIPAMKAAVAITIADSQIMARAPRGSHRLRSPQAALPTGSFLNCGHTPRKPLGLKKGGVGAKRSKKVEINLKRRVFARNLEGGPLLASLLCHCASHFTPIRANDAVVPRALMAVWGFMAKS